MCLLYFSTFPLTPEVFYPHQTGSYTALPCVNVPDKAVRIFHRISDSALQAAVYRDLRWCTKHTMDSTAKCLSDKKANADCFFPAEAPVDIRRTPIRICGYEILQPENPDKTPHSGCFAKVSPDLYFIRGSFFRLLSNVPRTRRRRDVFPQSISTMAQSLTTISTFTP